MSNNATKLPNGKEKTMYVLIEGDFLRARNYKIKASVGIAEVWKVMTTVLVTGGDPNRLKEGCFSRAWE